MPKCSIIIPTFNRANVLPDAVRSVLGQTQEDLELIVIDDGSTDSTRQVVGEINDSRVRYFFQSNGGAAAARNAGLDKVRGRYLAFLDSDDYWPPNYLETMLARLERNPNCGVVYSPITVVFENGEQIPSYKRPNGVEGRICIELFQRGVIWPTAVLFRTALWKDFSFDEAFSCSSEDSDAFLRLSLKTNFCFTDEVEAFHRISRDSLAAQSGTNEYRLLSLERFYFVLGGDRYVPRSVAYKKLGRTCRKLARYHYQNREYKAMAAFYRKAIRYRPLSPELYCEFLIRVLLSRGDDRSPNWKIPVLPHSIQTRRKGGGE